MLLKKHEELNDFLAHAIVRRDLSDARRVAFARNDDQQLEQLINPIANLPNAVFINAIRVSAPNSGTHLCNHDAVSDNRFHYWFWRELNGTQDSRVEGQE